MAFNQAAVHNSRIQAPDEATERKRAQLKDLRPAEFRDGARCAFTLKYPGEREPGGYPKGFLSWSLERRNAWFCGYYVGRVDRLRGER